MPNSILWGFGGVKFEQGGNTKELPDCYGTLGFRPESIVYRTKAGGTIIKDGGFRAIIKIEMLNIGHATATAGQMGGLIQMLNNSKTTGIMIYPRFNGIQSMGFLCHLTSDIAPDDFSKNIAAGQSLDLSFEGMSTVPNMPTYYSNPAHAYWVDKDGNNVVAKNNDKIVVKGE